jgi:hypothetical protein
VLGGHSKASGVYTGTAINNNNNNEGGGEGEELN